MKDKNQEFLEAWATLNPYFIQLTKMNDRTKDEIKDAHLSAFSLQFFLIFMLSFVIPIWWSWSLWWKVALGLFALAVFMTKIYHKQYRVYDKQCCPSCKGSGFRCSFKKSITVTPKGVKVKEKHLGYFPCDDQYHTYTESVPFVLLDPHIQNFIMNDFEMYPALPGAFIDTSKGNNASK